MKVVHRDIALRNFLYVRALGGYTAKIADLGLSRSTSTGEYASTKKVFPKRWTAPEAGDPASPTYLRFTSKSDVWSFGVAFWEILMRGATPYSDMKADDVVQAVVGGRRLAKPEILDEQAELGDALWNTVFRCFEKEPDARPRFKELFKAFAAVYAKAPEEAQPAAPEVEDDYEQDDYE